MDTRSKIQTPEQIIAELSQGLWTLAVGRFPALTAEHVEVLQQAAEMDGVLTVAVAADHWGGPYPLDEASRAQLVAAVDGVDLVVICDQSAVENLRKLGKPAAVIEVEKRVQRDIVADVIARHSQKPA
jgi:bifunctional ADP-heptose synthase (sugar kinase/adenylyltransferase)